MKKIITILSVWVLSAGPALAQADLTTPLNNAGSQPFGPPETNPDLAIGQRVSYVLSIFLGFLGTITFIIMLYGGFLWLTARGNDDQVATAKKYLFNGVIGTIIIMAAYSITFFITSRFAAL